MVLRFLFSFTCTQMGPSEVHALWGRGREALSTELCQLWHRQHSHSFTTIAMWQPQASWALRLCSKVLVSISVGQQESKSCNSYWCPTDKCEQEENIIDDGSFSGKPGADQVLQCDLYDHMGKQHWETEHICSDAIAEEASPVQYLRRPFRARSGYFVQNHSVVHRHLLSSRLGLNFALIIPVLHNFCE